MKGRTEGDYEVGYGKPPWHSRFQKGQSGNPRGRPRGSKNSTTLMMEALQELVSVNENGRRKKITKQEAIIKQIVNKAASGDYRSIQFLLLNQIPLIEAALASSRSATPEGVAPESHIDLFRAALKVLRDLDVPLPMELPNLDFKALPGQRRGETDLEPDAK
jgi:Family of unknown function (DUF5681)